MEDDPVAELAGFVMTGETVSLEHMRRILLERDRSLEVIFEAAGMGLVLGDMTGRTITCNKILLDMLGYDETEIRALGVEGITHPDDLATDLELFMELLEGKRDRYQLEKRYLRKDGSIMWGRMTVIVLRDESGQPHFGLGLLQDISEVKEAEEMRSQLRDAQESQRRALELHDSIVQGLTVAQLALEMNWEEKVDEAISGTLEKARKIVSDLLAVAESRGELVGPGSLVRSESDPSAPGTTNIR